ncbi:MAG: putative peptidoglycan glycosyltransferase FtsW [Rhizomicrobium sp.]|nr:putative peptidoglycan glycosyltransferase FtsW [Rhizomicrobium sp.]
MNRASRTRFADWWWTIDRRSAVIVIALISIGLMLAVAASPAASGGPQTAGNFNFAARQMVFALIALAILFGASLLHPEQLRRVAAIIFVGALIGSFMVLFLGTQTLGARRWLDLRVFTLQPSEFLKPSFAILAAAILTDANRIPLPKPLLTALVVVPALVILLLQPDVGQTFLLLGLWGAMLFFAGLSLRWVWAIGGGAAGLAVMAYTFFPHVHHRVLQFLHPSDKGGQVNQSLKAFSHGGLVGVGPGAGSVKYHLPDVHSDFIYAVAGEEFGLWLCVIIALLFCVLCVGLMLRSAKSRDPFAQLAGAGLAMVLAFQALINMAVALNMIPAKGMTLPFISSGGSSLFAVALTMGFALSLSRERPQAELQKARISPAYRGARS